jgi:microcystin-dependent protein
MAKFFVYPFAVAGDKTAIPEPTQGSGSVSYNEGWGPDYGLDLDTDPNALPIPRDQTNQLYYDITDAIRQYQTHGTPDFITTADNLGSAFAYDLYAYVRYDDGSGFKIYENQVQGNTALPSDPSWQVVSGNPIPAGSVLPFAGSVLPSGGYLFCDGTAVSRTTYAALFAAIGTAYGAGDGSTTFNLPFTARRVIVGAGGTGSATLPNTIGATGGAENVALTPSQNGDHTHETVPGFHISGPFKISAGNSQPRVWQTGGPVTQTGGVVGGAGQPHNNIQPSLVMNWIIKT